MSNITPGYDGVEGTEWPRPLSETRAHVDPARSHLVVFCSPEWCGGLGSLGHGYHHPEVGCHGQES